MAVSGDEFIHNYAVVIIAFLCGSIFSAFAARLAEQFPKGTYRIFPLAHCSYCKHALSSIDLMPIIGWYLRSGRCRYCSQPVSIRYVLFEVTGGCLWAATSLSVGNWLEIVVWWLFWLFIIVAIVTDLTYRIVPNWLSLPGTLVFLILSMVSGIQSPLSALLGAGICLMLLFLLVVLSGGNMGVGDMKLYAAIGALLGPWLGVFSLVVASLSGSIIGLTMRGIGLLRKREYIAFVPHIAIGVVVSVFWGRLLLHWYLHLLIVN